MNIKHGESKPTTKEYRAWFSIIARCTNKKNIGYHLYGGRGIKVCDQWRNSYSAFLLDVGRAPSPEHSIDRINNDGNYEPGNCKWSTRLEQTHNRRPFTMLPDSNKLLALADYFDVKYRDNDKRVQNDLRRMAAKLQELEKSENQDELHKEYLKEFELYRDSGRDYSKQIENLKSKFLISRRTK